MILALAIPLAIGWAYPLRILRNEEAETMHLDEVYFVIAVLLLPPMGVLAVFLLGTAAGLLWTRTVLAKFVFNLGQVMLSVVVGTGDLRAFQQRRPLARSSPPRSLAQWSAPSRWPSSGSSP